MRERGPVVLRLKDFTQSAQVSGHRESAHQPIVAQNYMLAWYPLKLSNYQTINDSLSSAYNVHVTNQEPNTQKTLTMAATLNNKSTTTDVLVSYFCA